ncbi:MAG: hypothetical protein PHH54_00590 [Candidatus Nanoarchaeia archaeon]|nr:hypothetical protein [Candidatus Nanoarchaeia archaeon]MDD5740460.1 hypothetical protein [Candidatus Nanoarchaeia archaeon]
MTNADTTKNSNDVLYSLSATLLRIEEPYVIASINERGKEEEIYIKDIPSFEKSNVLDVGSPFFYQICRNKRNNIYCRVVLDSLKEDEQPKIDKDLALILDELELRDRKLLEKIIKHNPGG